MAQAKALHPALPDRYFNVGFVIDPADKIVLRHYKLIPLRPVDTASTGPVPTPSGPSPTPPSAASAS
jgi:hypothetical protein